MRTLTFLDPGHFHAALTLREPHPLVSDEIAVYAPDGPELVEFLKLVDAFNRRSERPTKWRTVVRAGDGSLDRLLSERPGDVVILAGRNDRKPGLMRRLHDAGLHVLADKPWLTSPNALSDVRHVLAGGALAVEIRTGSHEITSVLAERLVREPEVFGGFETGTGKPSIRLASVHYLEKSVNGAPLRRPPWFFDVRVQGDGLADIPTHLVAEVQRLLAAHGRASEREMTLLAARRWPTPVPLALFSRVTGLAEFPPELRDRVDGKTLGYVGNAELSFRLRGVEVALATRWDPTPPPGGGDTHSAAIVGTRARVRIEQGLHTGYRRRLFVEPRRDGGSVQAALAETVGAWQAEYPGLAIAAVPRGVEIEIPDRLRTDTRATFRSCWTPSSARSTRLGRTSARRTRWRSTSCWRRRSRRRVSARESTGGPASPGRPERWGV